MDTAINVVAILAGVLWVATLGSALMALYYEGAARKIRRQIGR